MADDYSTRARAAQRALARNAKHAVRQRNYQTPLGADEDAFRAWVSENSVPFDPDDPTADYDMRGFWRGLQEGDPQAVQSKNPNDGEMHFPDWWKTPFHQSFSAESQYARPGAPIWINDHQLADPKTGRVVFDERR